MALKTNLTIILSCLFITLGKGQNTSGVVTYNYDLKLQNVKIKRKATLLFTDSTALFYHSRGQGIVAVDIEGNIGGPDLTYTTRSDHDGSPVIDFYLKDEWGTTYYFDFKNDRLFAREIVYLHPFQYEEPNIPDLNWEPLDTSKVIEGYLSLAAKVKFRGRTYTAWYTPEIPIPLGPWKLTGLPGLVLEAQDEEFQVVFKATTIKFGLSDDEKQLIKPAKDGKEITFEEFKGIYWSEQLRINRQANSTQHRGGEAPEVFRLNTVEIFPEEKR